MSITIKYCKDFPNAPNCCISCHEEAGEYWPDYPLCQITKNQQVIAEVCCAVVESARKELENMGLI
jgi:hypothetical protein